MPFEKCTPLAIRDLTLQKINLRYAADTYCRVIDFRAIKALRVFGCSGADSLFAELSKVSRDSPIVLWIIFGLIGVGAESEIARKARNIGIQA